MFARIYGKKKSTVFPQISAATLFTALSVFRCGANKRAAPFSKFQISVAFFTISNYFLFFYKRNLSVRRFLEGGANQRAVLNRGNTVQYYLYLGIQVRTVSSLRHRKVVFKIDESVLMKNNKLQNSTDDVRHYLQRYAPEHGSQNLRNYKPTKNKIILLPSQHTTLERRYIDVDTTSKR